MHKNILELYLSQMDAQSRFRTSVNLVSLDTWEREKPFVTDSVAVQNLEAFAHVYPDAWGRDKAQPAKLSVKLSLTRPFTEAASFDSLTGTVHYGMLSKKVLERLDGHTNPDDLCRSLVELCIGEGKYGDPDEVATIEVTCSLPKGTRHGASKGLTIRHFVAKNMASFVLGLHRLSVPCIIGVNYHEREMKQIVLASVWLDGSPPWVSKKSPALEQLVVKTIDESSYETLEALAEELAGRIVKYFIYAHYLLAGSGARIDTIYGVRIRLEKPSAIVLAESPAVEIYRSTAEKDPWLMNVIADMGTKNIEIPFPLTGRLDEFLQSRKQD